MAGLAKTLAELAARSRTLLPNEPEDALSPVGSFGSNPGALQMRLYLPEELPAPAPLVIVLHGCGQSASGYAAGAGWVELADRYGFALLCPEQVRSNNANLCFNWFDSADVVRGAGEPASIIQMIEFALGEHALDPRRVFVTGLSAGGAMAAVMLAAYPEIFAAGAVIAGLPYGAASGVQQAFAAMRRVPDLTARTWGDKVRAAAPPPARWPRISIWHGAADTTVTPAAGEALARQWCDLHAISLKASHESDGPAYEGWRGADGRVAVELHRIAGLGHGVPISSGGEDGCGSPAPWILEAGISSSLQIARFWGITAARRCSDGRHAPFDRARPTPNTPAHASTNVGETITRALRGAGLLR